MKNLFLLFSLMSLFLVGCASTSDVKDYPLYNQHVAQVMEKQEEQTNSLIESEVPDLSKVPVYTAPGNMFVMSHPNDSKLSGKFRADFNGVLQLPYNITINVTNKTFSELRESVISSYRKFFQKGVEDVKFTQSGKDIWVEVRGMVKKPGRYLVRPSDSLDLVVDAAGGVQGDISIDYFSATMKQSKYEYQVLLNKYFEANGSADKIRWLGGDSVFVSKLDGLSGVSKEVPFVTLIGGVVKPGKVLHQKDASLYYYIEKSGGLLQGLGYQECYVFRNTKEGVKRINFSFDKPDTIPVIFPNDTVYMNSKVVTAGDEWLSRFSQVAGIISTAALLIIAL